MNAIYPTQIQELEKAGCEFIPLEETQIYKEWQERYNKLPFLHTLAHAKAHKYAFSSTFKI